MTDAQWEVFSYEAVIAAAVLYVLAMLAYFFELASLRTAGKDVELATVGAAELGEVVAALHEKTGVKTDSNREDES